MSHIRVIGNDTYYPFHRYYLPAIVKSYERDEIVLRGASPQRDYVDYRNRHNYDNRFANPPDVLLLDNAEIGNPEVTAYIRVSYKRLTTIFFQIICDGMVYDCIGDYVVAFNNEPPYIRQVKCNGIAPLET